MYLQPIAQNLKQWLFLSMWPQVGPFLKFFISVNNIIIFIQFLQLGTCFSFISSPPIISQTSLSHLDGSSGQLTGWSPANHSPPATRGIIVKASFALLPPLP